MCWIRHSLIVVETVLKSHLSKILRSVLQFSRVFFFMHVLPVYHIRNHLNYIGWAIKFYSLACLLLSAGNQCEHCPLIALCTHFPFIFFRLCMQQQAMLDSHGHSSPDSRLALLTTAAHSQLLSLSPAEDHPTTVVRPLLQRSVSECCEAVLRPRQRHMSTGAHYFNVDRWNASIGEFDEYSW